MLEQVRIEPGIIAAGPLNFTYYPLTHSLGGRARMVRRALI